ncbi:MAG: amidohydrolase family protein [Clostridia bacterium]|nr:amidohydrolase family protein [Clostridia bacterium]
MTYNKKIDFHSHYLSETYYEYLEKFEDEKPDSFPTPHWSVEEQLKLMEKLGIAFAFLSVSSPNLSRADKETEIRMVRKINIEGSKMVSNNPEKLGLFASLPLPHEEAAIEEAKFAIEELKSDGFGLSTHYAGVYLGDKRYDRLMAYLNEVSAVVAVHPVKPSSIPKNVNEELPIPAMEFLIDTTRTFTNMVMNNIFERFPKIKWIFPHAGAFIPVLSDRIEGFAMQFRAGLSNGAPINYKADMKRVYFDVAGFPVNKQLHDLLLDVGAENLLYGSDSPYTPKIACVAQTGNLERAAALNETEKEKMFTLNAVKLFPKLENILGITAEHKRIGYDEKPLDFHEKANGLVRKIISKLYSKVFA